MKKIILVYLLIQIFASCGSVQSVNGVRVKAPARTVRKDVFIGIATFGAGYFLGDKYIIKRK
jgi:hypothetical protein